MNTEIIIHAAEFPTELEYIQNEIDKALSGKLDVYIKKHIKEGDKIRVELSMTRSKKNFSGKLEVLFPGGGFRSVREDFAKLDDLINHLFSHIKDQMAK